MATADVNRVVAGGVTQRFGVSALAEPPLRGHPAEQARWTPTRWSWLEQLVVFLVAAAVFIAVGVYTTVDLHVVYPDAESRLTHAYLVWWNIPPKLSAIGFVWPPMQTLALLPFALLKPLATSLVALPVFAGLCGAVVAAVLNRTLTIIGVSWVWRIPMLLAFCANPIFLDYASNGMAEILFLMLLALGLHYFVSWYMSDGMSTKSLLLSGLFMGIAFLARYELGVWIAAMAGSIVWIKQRRIPVEREIEANVMIFLAPVVYCVVVWSAITMMVIGGGPLAWLTRAGDQGQGALIHHPDPLKLALDTIEVTARISPLLWFVPAALIVLGIVRRQRFAGVMAVFVLVGAVTTFALVVGSPHTGLLQLRYNIRALPPALIGAGWLMCSLPYRWQRMLAGWLSLLALVAAIPLAYQAMLHYPYQYQEQAFVRALRTGKSQSGTGSIGGYLIGDRSDKRMAEYIDAHVKTDKSILLDDASLPGVILLSGRPQLFVTRVDHGDSAWLRVLARPWGKVQYMLVSWFATDLITTHDPSAYAGKLPGTKVVFRTQKSVLLSVSRTAPGQS
jgi:hypothetical protein